MNDVVPIILLAPLKKKIVKIIKLTLDSRVNFSLYSDQTTKTPLRSDCICLFEKRAQYFSNTLVNLEDYQNRFSCSVAPQ